MFTYQIIKHKEVVPPPSPHTHSHNIGQIYSQPHLNYFLQKQPKVGDFIYYCTGPASPLYSHHQISYVVYVEDNYSNINKNCVSGMIARTHEILGIEPFGNGKPWFSWVDIRNYKVLTDAEVSKFINVDISNYIQATLKARAEATQTPTP